jgi:hypothetical protein
LQFGKQALSGHNTGIVALHETDRQHDVGGIGRGHEFGGLRGRMRHRFFHYDVFAGPQRVQRQRAHRRTRSHDHHRGDPEHDPQHHPAARCGDRRNRRARRGARHRATILCRLALVQEPGRQRAPLQRGIPASYISNLHNFVDYRREFPARTAEQNEVLDAICRDFRAAGLSWLQAHHATGKSDAASAALIGRAIRRLGGELGAIDAELGIAFAELCDVWDNPDLDAAAVASMQHFSGLFGRETAYVSLVIQGPAA